jgi:ABC-type nitrate/sulfonate/bicarbonate transport system substrate-binding protein
MKRRWKSAILVALMALLVSPAVTFGQLRTVKVGTTSKLVLDNLPMFVGMHMKFFEEVGIKLEPSYLRGGGETVRAMTTRSVEFNASSAAVPVLIAIDKGEPIKIVSSQVGGMVGVHWVV